MTTPANMRWKLVDRDTGAENAQIDWTFRVGDQVKLRLVNEMDSDHPMPHPFHVHGAGRFLILARDGVVEADLVTASSTRPAATAPARYPATSAGTTSDNRTAHSAPNHRSAASHTSVVRTARAGERARPVALEL